MGAWELRDIELETGKVRYIDDREHTCRKFFPSGIQHFWTMISLPDPLFFNFSSWTLISLPVIKFEVWIPPSPLPKLNDLIPPPPPQSWINPFSYDMCYVHHAEIYKIYAHVSLSLLKYFTQKCFFLPNEYFSILLYWYFKCIFRLESWKITSIWLYHEF